MASERTPLLQRESTKLHLVEGLTTKSWFASALSIPYAAFFNHGWSVIAAVASALACWWLGYAEKSVFDSLIFKSILVIFGFAIGFRNSRANERRSQAQSAALELFSNAWSLLVVFPSDSRPKVREALLYLLEAISQHIRIGAHRELYKYSIIGLRPQPPKRPAWWEFSRNFQATKPDDVHLGPRPLMATTILMLEEEFERIYPNNGNSLILRGFHQTVQSLKKSYEEIVSLSQPSISDRLVMLIDFCLFMFGVALPWGIKSYHLNLYDTVPDPKVEHFLVHVSAGAFLVLNTLVCTTVLFGLNALAHEHEDPFGDSGDDVDLGVMLAGFRKAVQCYEERREMAEQGNAGSSSEDVMKQHRFICGDADAPEKV